MGVFVCVGLLVVTCSIAHMKAEITEMCKGCGRRGMHADDDCVYVSLYLAREREREMLVWS